jgi:prephenate dehydratase
MPNKWIAVTNFAFNLPNKPGELARLTADLRAAGINLLGLWGYAEGEDEPRVSCVPESPDQFRRYCSPRRLRCDEGKALYMIGEDRPGALHDALRRIADARINLEAIECVSAGNRFGCFLWVADEDWDVLERMLTSDRA